MAFDNNYLFDFMLWPTWQEVSFFRSQKPFETSHGTCSGDKVDDHDHFGDDDSGSVDNDNKSDNLPWWHGVVKYRIDGGVDVEHQTREIQKVEVHLARKE